MSIPSPELTNLKAPRGVPGPGPEARRELGLSQHTRLAFMVIGDDELDHRKLSREGRTSETRTLERQRILHRFLIQIARH
jgi:hypothetical protein